MIEATTLAQELTFDELRVLRAHCGCLDVSLARGRILSAVERRAIHGCPIASEASSLIHALFALADVCCAGGELHSFPVQPATICVVAPSPIPQSPPNP